MTSKETSLSFNNLHDRGKKNRQTYLLSILQLPSSAESKVSSMKMSLTPGADLDFKLIKPSHPLDKYLTSIAYTSAKKGVKCAWSIILNLSVVLPYHLSNT